MDTMRHMEDWSDDELAFRRRESIPEVGSAYLFETPQSGVRRMPRLLDPMDHTIDDDDNGDGDVHYDSGVHYTNDAFQKLKKDDDSAYYSSDTNDIRYKPNTSWRRRSHSQ